MKWMSFLIAALSLASEVMKYLSEKEKNKKEKVKMMKSLKDGFKEARKTSDTANLERALCDIGVDIGRNSTS